MRFVWGVIKRWCVVAITASMTMSCGASWHLKRAIAKDPTIARDTIVRVDTTIVTNERRVVDTLVVRDTIVREIKSNGARVRIQRIHDTIRVDVVCPPDTIRVVAEVPVDRLIYKEQPPKRSLLDQVGVILFLILLITIAMMVSRFMKG
jgi:hypothetical protein